MTADNMSPDDKILQSQVQSAFVAHAPDSAIEHKWPSHKTYLNGRFLAASPAGVHRVAEELIVAVDSLLSAEPALAAAFDLTLATPRNIRRQPRLDNIHGKTVGRLSGILWEQFDLSRLTADGLCISLCNAGPLARRNAMTMLHDAQVYSMPASYSFAFRFWYKITQPLIGHRHRRILTVSDFSKSELVRYGVAPAEKISVISNGCDHILRISPDDTAIARLGLANKAYVLALANTQHHKNIRILLEAFANPALKHTTLALFGGATAADFEAMGYKAPGNAVFLGKIPDAELVGLMQGATAFACPSLTEGFGLPPLEAMLLGCPAIVAPCGALPEICADAALTADPHDATAWVRQISRLMTDNSLREDMCARGEIQAGKFTWQRAARQLLKAIAEEKNILAAKELLL